MNPHKNENPQIEPVVGALRVVDATGRKSSAFKLSAAPYAASLNAPSYAARPRSGERLFLLLDLTRTAPPHRYRELCELFAQTYWSEIGSITAGLRRAVATVNRRIFFENLAVDPTERCVGGLAGAVLKEHDVFIALAGDVQACVFQDGRLIRLSQDDLTPLRALGMSQAANVYLGHVFVAPGDRLLLTSSSLPRAAGEGGIARVIPREGLADVMEGLEQVGAGADFVALLMDCATPDKASAAREVLQSLSRLKETVRTRTETTHGRPEPAERPSSAVEAPEPEVEQSPEPAVVAPPPDYAPSIPTTPGPARPVEQIPVHIASASEDAPLPAPEETPEIIREPTSGLADRVTDRVKEGAGGVGLALSRGKRAVGQALSGAGGALVGGLRALPRRVLPGPERPVRRRSRRPSRPAPQEDSATMIALAVGIPILLAIIVMWAYQAFGEKSQFESVIDQANQAIELAQSAGGVAESARPHWEAALAHADAALALRPDDQVAVDLRTKAQSALDQLDKIERLSTLHLWDFGHGDVARRLVAHGQMIFVLDPAGEWVARLTLNANADGVVEQGDPYIIRRGQEIGDHAVGDLIDFVWVESMGGRQSSGLLVLEENGAVVVYDPAWEGDGGEIQLSWFALETLPETPMEVDTYDGRLYVLDAAVNQVRRYKPQGDRYPGRPENYFVDPPPRPIREALDMAIDGYIYLLYPGGEIHKFLSGQPEPFVVQDVPGDLDQASALAVDPRGSSGAIYVIDQTRVVALSPDGAFRAQFRADDAFESIEAAAVDESSARFYVINAGQLYLASMP